MDHDALTFGLGIPADAGSGADPLSVARTAERLAFDFVSINDHVHGAGARLEAWTALAWIAANTSRIRVATRVLGVPYRHPAIVAKMAETFDRLSNGRLILGLGAGSASEEFHALGLAIGPLRARIEGLEEAIRIARGLWSGQPTSFDGTHYRLHGAQLDPGPGHTIPIWLGTNGQRGLELTGRLADGWIPSLGSVPADQLAAKLAVVRQSARDAGRDPRAVTCVCNVEVSIGASPSLAGDVIGGTPSQVADRLVEILAQGFDGFNFIPSGPDRERQVDALGRDVIPALRAAAGRAPSAQTGVG